MKFCPIMPIKAFEHFEFASDHWMALAQYLHLKPYLEFFQKKVEQGETVILDNGAYEGAQMADHTLARWVRELKPSVIVLPDAPGKFALTLVKAEEYLSRFGLPTGTEGMTVLHAPDGQLAQFDIAYQLVQTKWVGFSRLTRRYGSVHWPNQRHMYAEYLHQTNSWRPELHHHALGMLNGDISELAKLSRLGFRSCDSSAPIWRGLLGYSLTDSWPGWEFLPTAGEEADNVQQAALNLGAVKGACNGQG